MMDRTSQLIAAANVTTAIELPGHRIVANHGIARGIVVRSRGALGTFGASIQMFFGGDITLWSRLCDEARGDAFGRMIVHAATLGGNAVVAMRYDATELSAGVTEVLAYGTAVTVERI